jgi:hypothetical protein
MRGKIDPQMQRKYGARTAIHFQPVIPFAHIEGMTRNAEVGLFSTLNMGSCPFRPALKS